MFFLRAYIEEEVVLTFLTLEFIFDNIFGHRKDIFYPVFVFACFSSAVCYLVLYMPSEGLNISWLYRGKIQFQYLETVFAIPYFTLSLAGSQFIFLKCDGPIWGLEG